MVGLGDQLADMDAEVRADAGAVVSFRIADRNQLGKVEVEIGGVTTVLKRRNQSVSTPFTGQDEVLVTVRSSTPARLVVSWRGR